MSNLTYRDALMHSMRAALKDVPESFVYGLGVTDTTGIFGTTTNLGTEFGGERIFNTPICEESMVGFSVGAALGGLYPINIHIRNDFLLLAMNQIVNSISKYRSMYGGMFELPLLIRAIIGRSWGQGAQHSQSLHSVLSHFPGLRVIMPATANRVLHTYENVVGKYRGPVIMLEHRALYDLEFHREEFTGSFMDSQILHPGNDVTLISLSYPVIQGLHVARHLARQGLSVEVIDLHCVSHPSKELILQSLRKTKRAVIIDVGWMRFGVGGEVATWILQDGLKMEKTVFLGSPETPCPTAHSLERHFYPQTEDIARACYEAAGESAPGLNDLEPLEKKKMRGPF